MTTDNKRITSLLAGMDTVYFSCDLPLSDAMRERLTQDGRAGRRGPHTRCSSHKQNADQCESDLVCSAL
jgi:hypothetical protein